MKLLGILLILNSIGITAWLIITTGTHKVVLISLCLICVFVGITLILSDRITELTVKGVGTIKTASQQAASDAKAISKLKQRVENQSATVDIVAKEASEAAKLSEKATKSNQEAQEKLKQLDKSLIIANSTIDEIKEFKKFVTTVSDAQLDDRSAFDKLDKWSKDNNYKYRQKAEQAWLKIYQSHNEPMYTSGFNVPWKEGIKPEKFSFVELQNEYAKAPYYLKPAFLEYIWKRNDIPKVDRLDFMMNIMKSDPNLTAVEYAGRFFTQGTKLKIQPMALEYLSNWWTENRKKILTEGKKE